ncbi:nitrate/sulfonate/bicarbonate ABC transporter ATP-binding protein [Streptomyces sulfonofaciens]|uniref:Nitrate/sulfonate/bicarbonate ABC transporter ATP-binding protein n=1 Tax=Streptomyces sulfonofaciens TaxID=68272 RepID=A0A919GGJ0_9ACTN|nr:ABC transporter ATP-binding protein [Streptomyces sulfonofaciens]GHH83916.1 nitrate/sulfonate/bicarbonate ABC transporter ATP-binding protein [Streptomyces sulfonofaciens]
MGKSAPASIPPTDPDTGGGPAGSTEEGTAPDPDADPRTESADAGSPRAALELSGVTKHFPLRRRNTVALDGVDLTVEQGEFVSLLGPSGCGKSTVLRLLAGLEEPTTGRVRVHDRPPAALVNDHRLGIAFQQHALLPWASIADNVALPFRVAGRPVDRARVTELLRLTGLEEFAEARPRQLSGGMRQRAAIARALALNPEVLLLDEPFGSLDAVTRRRLNFELARIWSEQRITTLLVTHDVEEAVLLANRVVVLTGRPGRVRHVEHIDLPRPRGGRLTREPRFHEVVDRLTALLDGDLASRAGADEGATAQTGRRWLRRRGR